MQKKGESRETSIIHVSYKILHSLQKEYVLQSEINADKNTYIAHTVRKFPVGNKSPIKKVLWSYKR